MSGPYVQRVKVGAYGWMWVANAHSFGAFEKVSSKSSAHLLLVVVHEYQMRPGDPENILCLDALFHNHAWPQMLRLNEDAPSNMDVIPTVFGLFHGGSATADTAHLEMSPLNDDAPRNMRSMLVTLDTTHLETSPLNDDAP